MLFRSKRNNIKEGDYIAIKRIVGNNPKKIEIRAVGEVTGVEHEDIGGRKNDEGFKQIYVNWKKADLSKKVDSKGCYKSIHGPFYLEDEWTKEVFYPEFVPKKTLV